MASRLTTLLTHDQLLSWGWRLPYFFGMLVGPAGLYIRSRLAETPEFLEAEQPESMPIRELLSKHPLPVLLAIGISIISNSSFYILLYIPTYGQKTLHLPAYTGFIATLIGGFVLAIFCPIFGHWSDKIVAPAHHGGRRLAVFPDLVAMLLPDVGVADAGGVHHRRLVAATAQGRV